MLQNPHRRRLVLAIFLLSCLSVAVSTALVIWYVLNPDIKTLKGQAGDLLGKVESDLASGRSSSAWEELGALSQKPGFHFGVRGLTLLWNTWQREHREGSLREIASEVHDRAASDEERALSVYLLLETGQAEWALKLDKPGYWTTIRPDLEAELSLHRSHQQVFRFSSLNTPDYKDDTRILLDRAYALGYLGDYAAARQMAATVVSATDAPGSNGSTGIIDVNRGLCRRQAARMVQILSVWDGRDSEGESSMREALIELCVDPQGLYSVAPRYFDVLLDAAAFTGERSRLDLLYSVADRNNHVVSDEHKENRALLSANPILRPENYTDLRRIIASNEARDPRFKPTVLYEAAGHHNDDRSWRLATWFLWNTGDFGGVDELLSRVSISHGAWSDFWSGVRSEASGNLQTAFGDFKSSQSGTLDTVSALNQARILLRQGKVETAAVVAATARNNIAVRSLGLSKERGNGYSSLYADALALEVRIMRAQGREEEAEGFLRELQQIDSNHPELYNARGIQEMPEPPIGTQ